MCSKAHCWHGISLYFQPLGPFPSTRNHNICIFEASYHSIKRYRPRIQQRTSSTSVRLPQNTTQHTPSKIMFGKFKAKQGTQNKPLDTQPLIPKATSSKSQASAKASDPRQSNDSKISGPKKVKHNQHLPPGMSEAEAIRRWQEHQDHLALTKAWNTRP